MKYYDIHTHKNYTNKDVVSILNCDAGDFSTFCDLDLQHIFYSLGLHPWKIKGENWADNIDYIEKNAILENIKAIGECGLDKLCNTTWKLQMKTFIVQIEISENIRKPLIIHCVKAFDELIALKKEINPKQAWIIHGFRGKPQQTEQLVKQGFFLSFGTKFNKDSLRIIPLDRLFLETDDVMNETIKEVYIKISKSLGINLKALMNQISLNIQSVNLFR